MSRTSIDRDSVEYLRVPLTSPAGVDVGTLDVKVAVVPSATRPVAADFLPASWDDATDEAVLLVGPLLTPGVRWVWVKISDAPEVPVMEVGGITVT